MSARLTKNRPHPSRHIANLENERMFYFAKTIQLRAAIKKFKETKTTGDMLAMFEAAEDEANPAHITPVKHQC